MIPGDKPTMSRSDDLSGRVVARGPSPGGGVVINAPVAQLGSRHVILWGRGRTHHVHDFIGPLSIKSVIRGNAVWSTDAGALAIDESVYMVVNDRQPYSIDVESDEAVETFCVFFRRGFLQEARRLLVGGEDLLLDEPGPETRDDIGFETVRARDCEVMTLMKEMHRSLARGRRPGGWLEDHIVELGGALMRAQQDVRRQMARIPAARASTRSEIYRRLRRAVDFAEGSLVGPLSLDALARAACLSPFHFHRRFTETFGETPHEFVRRRRLDTARDLLVGTALPVTVICHRTGFESLGSFSALFRRRFGVPPLKFRRAGRPDRKIREKRPAVFCEDPRSRSGCHSSTGEDVT